MVATNNLSDLLLFISVHTRDQIVYLVMQIEEKFLIDLGFTSDSTFKEKSRAINNNTEEIFKRFCDLILENSDYQPCNQSERETFETACASALDKIYRPEL